MVGLVIWSERVVAEPRGSRFLRVYDIRFVRVLFELEVREPRLDSHGELPAIIVAASYNVDVVGITQVAESVCTEEVVDWA